jgi:phosphotriesterase-related protein
MKIRTVTGDVPADKIGRTLTHEHLLYTYPGGEYDHNSAFRLDDAVRRIARELKEGMDQWGYATIVDMTPCEVGRHPELMKRVAQDTGCNVIAVTGFFPESMGLPYWYKRQTVDELADFYVRDITQGMVFAGTQTDIKAGAIKIATGQEGVNPKPSPLSANGLHISIAEERLIRAAGRAQKKTGVCINTHTDPMDYLVTNPGIEQLDLVEQEGGDPAKVIIGHAFIEPKSVEQIVDVCKRGANVQIDHMGIPWRHDNTDQLDESMANLMCEVADRGYLSQMTITYDRWFFNPRGPATEDNPQLLNEKVGLGYLFESFAPRLEKKGFRARDLETLLVDNPRRILAF